jgi:predicted nucleotidyltransferase
MIVTQRHLDTIIGRAKEYGATKVILFGSALESPHEAQDIDLAADIPGLALYAFAGQLEHDLRCTIDIVPLHLHTPFLEAVKERGTIIYEQMHNMEIAE